MLTVVYPYSEQPWLEKTVRHYTASPQVKKLLVVGNADRSFRIDGVEIFKTPAMSSSYVLAEVIDRVSTEYVLLVCPVAPVVPCTGSLDRLLYIASAADVGIIYADYRAYANGRAEDRHLIPYQAGSIRDDFDFGPVLLFSTEALRQAKGRTQDNEFRRAGLYDLRLKVATRYAVKHVPEVLFEVEEELKEDGTEKRERHFDYVDPVNIAVQKEMESAATNHLKRIGAYLPPIYKELDELKTSFPVELSVVIPVLNRRTTISDAIKSALSQKTDFSFNIIIVDNHSTDGTTDIVADMAARHAAVHHLVPESFSLQIGGCWNEAIHSKLCGRYAVQLDSDDLYADLDSLRKMYSFISSDDYAMVIGSYTLVDENMAIIPPGVIDHREWTDENGRNNALRINGLGAPRAFRTDLIRKIGFLNVSYGEDYAAALRISREYRIGRIYESVYLCKRWQGNTDASLPRERINRNNLFKDWVRTLEIAERQKINQANDR
ncbi:MAG: glycosyltransferase family A protein [Smithellaceae bacterium]|nr:glycosyltransferase family A protein [Smithellaceae bacterium]